MQQDLALSSAVVFPNCPQKVQFCSKMDFFEYCLSNRHKAWREPRAPTTKKNSLGSTSCAQFPLVVNTFFFERTDHSQITGFEHLSSVNHAICPRFDLVILDYLLNSPQDQVEDLALLSCTGPDPPTSEPNLACVGNSDTFPLSNLFPTTSLLNFPRQGLSDLCWPAASKPSHHALPSP